MADIPGKSSKLIDAVRAAHRALEPFRRNRREAIKQYVGYSWSDDGSDDKVPLNLIGLAIDIHQRLLTPSRPAVYMTARVPQLRQIASSFESQLNQWASGANLARTIQLLIQDALFLAAFVKIGVEPAGTIDVYGQPIQVGKPFVSRISPDDWFHDTEARRWEDMRFCGHYYAANLDELRANPTRYNPAVVARLKPATWREREDGDKERAQEIGGSVGEADANTIDETVELCDVWRPRQRLIVTYADQIPDTPVAVVPWDGPPSGPFDMLALGDVPDSIMPIPPVAFWRGIHDPTNHVLRKIIRQVERQKRLTVARLGGDQDLEKVQAAQDGDVVPMQAPEQTKEIGFGGFPQESLAFVIGMKDVFNWSAGNLDLLGGLSPQAETATQDKLLNESANRRVREYQDRVVDFMRRVFKSVAFHIWRDPYMALPMPTQNVPGTSINVPVPFGPEQRQGAFNDYQIEITPHAMVSYSPQERSSALQAIVREMTSIAPILMSQGLYVDYGEVLRQHAKLLNLPELEYIVRFAGPVPPVAYGQMNAGGAGGADGGPPDPNKPNGHYVRENRAARTRHGADYALTQAMLGKGTQDSERAGAIGVNN